MSQPNGKQTHAGRIYEIGDKFLPWCECGQRFEPCRLRYLAGDDLEAHQSQNRGKKKRGLKWNH